MGDEVHIKIESAHSNLTTKGLLTNYNALCYFNVHT